MILWFYRSMILCSTSVCVCLYQVLSWTSEIVAHGAGECHMCSSMSDLLSLPAQENKQIGFSGLTSYVSPVCRHGWRQHPMCAAMSVSSVFLGVFFWDICSAFLLDGPASRKAAALSVSPSRDPDSQESWTGGRLGPGLLEVVAAPNVP